jgi:uncharacterized membrane protein
MMALGILGLVTGDFASVWQPVPKDIPAREALAYLCAFISLAAGAGLLLQRYTSIAVRVLLVYLLLWLLLLKAPDLFRAPAVEASWLGCGEIAVLVAGAWSLFACFSGNGNSNGNSNGKGLRGAQLLFGVALIPLGLAHLVYAKETAQMVPGWLPAHLLWAYLTGATYLAAAAAVLIGKWAREAAALTALQMGLFTLLVWGPMLAANAKGAFQWGGALISLALAGGALAVADSYRGARR